MVDLTDDCAEFVRQETDGLLHVFVPHATAGIAILETGAGSDDDLLAQLDVLLPRDDRWRHRHGSPGHGRDHVVPAFIPPHASVPVLEGLLQLGTWQRICLVDTNTDNHQRHVRLLVPRRLTCRPLPPFPAAGRTRQDAGHDRQRHRHRTRPPLPRRHGAGLHAARRRRQAGIARRPTAAGA